MCCALCTSRCCTIFGMPTGRDLLRTPLPFIKFFLCFRLFTYLVENLAADCPWLVLVCDFFSFGIWLAFVLFVGFEVARFEYHRWRCAKFCRRRKQDNDFLVGTSNFYGSSRCQSLVQTCFVLRASTDGLVRRVFCLIRPLPSRRPNAANLGNTLELSCSEPVENLEQQAHDWKSRLARKVWRRSMLKEKFQEENDEEDENTNQAFITIFEPLPNTMERLQHKLEAQPVAIPVVTLRNKDV